MSPPAAYPEVPDFLLAQWQELMSLVSVDCGVPAALIMRVHPSQIEVLVSDGSDSPYHPGERENLCTGLYCEHVIATRERLHIPNALTDPNWDHNPDLRLGMISYLGHPLLWPALAHCFGMRPDAAGTLTPRPLDDRARGALRLLRRQAMALACQGLLVLAALVTRIV